MGKPQVPEWGARPFLHLFLQRVSTSSSPRRRCFPNLVLGPALLSLLVPLMTPKTANNLELSAIICMEVAPNSHPKKVLHPPWPLNSSTKISDRRSSKTRHPISCPISVHLIFQKSVLSFPSQLMIFVTRVTNAMAFPSLIPHHPYPFLRLFQKKKKRKKRSYHLLHIYYAPGPFIHDLILTSTLWVLSLTFYR